MTAETRSLLAAVLALPEAELNDFVGELLDAWSPATDELDSDEFRAELQRRSEEFDRDPSIGIPWSEVKGMKSAEDRL